MSQNEPTHITRDKDPNDMNVISARNTDFIDDFTPDPYGTAYSSTGDTSAEL